jgi:hypothetical protein
LSRPLYRVRRKTVFVALSAACAVRPALKRSPVSDRRPLVATFEGFSGPCGLVDVRFAPKARKPGPAQERCVWPGACDSSSQTGELESCAMNSPCIHPAMAGCALLSPRPSCRYPYRNRGGFEFSHNHQCAGGRFEAGGQTPSVARITENDSALAAEGH